ncbi:4Fe-4S dicluster domain-containing protein [Chloroflexota bacterium]
MSTKYGILVNIEECLGCGVCVIACKQENGLPPHTDDRPGTIGIAWNQVLSLLDGVYPDLSMYYLYLHCMHCENPPCIPSCPKGAIQKRDDGIVLIAKSKCDACRNEPDGIKKCTVACPYGAIQFNEQRGVVEACTMCLHRVEAGQDPACVNACMGGALTFGDLNDSGSKISQAIAAAKDRVFVLLPEKGTSPSVQYVKPREASLKRVSRLDKAVKMYGFEKQK